MPGSSHSEAVELNGAGNANIPVKCPPSVNEKFLIRKMDFRILPMLFVIYVSAFLDRRVLNILLVFCAMLTFFVVLI